ncbi:thiosulfate sulfurtransferase GlpE [Comamonadaceae bacterium OS-4]|uniref:Rhodanese-like domain-containing protein n=1 Tax=Rhodoferax potami TaxID=3068338 RepID=A0ABU3KPL7_9BURK|nr:MULTISPECIES: rhodanese-like domain-containing protein [unclassified Rhodoferax]MDT7519735.1 rhodanese-like domain-containing protein [Rhodoferax sp. TBRC 17660]MDZ7891410.1 rhodanese-like domain-containing protein [Rhodoferax sp.]BDT73201.1 thiosulfate sulfurtransferase GlpE [Comamonadaceae bacterium OS-4]
MKFFIDNWMLIAIALSSGGLLLWPVFQGATAVGIDSGKAIQLINREKANVVDVSDAAEFAAGHIVGSKNLPLADLEAKLAGAVKNKGLPLVLVCQSGARSAKAVNIAKKLGYEQAQSMQGGLKAWKLANLPVEKA